MPNPHLPAETLDHIVDHLHDKERALRNCCLVSRTWIPRTRRHLFANIKLQTKVHQKSWKETFPDPSTSPARYARSLSISCSLPVTAAEAAGWIGGFSRVVHLEVNSLRFHPGTLAASLPPFHGFSPIKSLYVDLFVVPSPQVFDLILSFPLLEDLTVRACVRPANYGDGSDGLLTAVQPSSSPAFSGTLKLSMVGGIRPIAHRLLSLPGSINFRGLTLKWDEEEDILLTVALVKRCSHTLESVDITCKSYGTHVRHLSSHR